MSRHAFGDGCTRALDTGGTGDTIAEHQPGSPSRRGDYEHQTKLRSELYTMRTWQYSFGSNLSYFGVFAGNAGVAAHLLRKLLTLLG